MLKLTRTAESTPEQDRDEELSELEQTEEASEGSSLFEEIDSNLVPHV